MNQTQAKTLGSAAILLQQPKGTLAHEVSQIIAQARAGNTLDIAHTAHAHDTQAWLKSALKPYPALQADIADKISSFAQKSGTANLYLHLTVTAKTPDLGEYDPSQVYLYDGIQNTGTEFSSVEMRATIYGTVMTSVNITDLAAYFRSGNQYVMVLHLGTNRQHDQTTLDQILSTLPAMLEGAGLTQGEIAQITTLISQGNLPPAAHKALMLASQIAVLKAAPNPALHAQTLQTLSRQYAALLAGKPTLAGLPLTLANALTRLTPLLHIWAQNPSLPIKRAISAQNDNHTHNPVTNRLARKTPNASNLNASGLKMVRALMAALRAARPALKALSPQQRRILAAALRDLRAGIRNAPAARTANARTANMAASAAARTHARSRLPAGLARLNNLLAAIITAPHPSPALRAALPQIISSVLPASLAATARFSRPALLASFKNTLTPLLSSPLSPRSRASLAAALSGTRLTPAPYSSTRSALAQTLLAHPDISTALHASQPATNALANNILSAPPAELSVPISLQAAAIISNEGPQTVSKPPVSSDVTFPDATPPASTPPSNETPTPDTAMPDTAQPVASTTTPKNPAFDTPQSPQTSDLPPCCQPDVKIETKDDVAHYFGQDIARNITPEQATAYVASSAQAKVALAQSGLAIDTAAQSHQDALSRLVSELSGTNTNTNPSNTGGHNHSGPCNCFNQVSPNTPKNPSTQNLIQAEQSVQVLRINPTNDPNAPFKRPKEFKPL